MRAVFLLTTFVIAITSPAAVLNWTNTNSGNWSVVANWSPNQLPSTNDVAVITNAGWYTVTLNADPTIAGLVLGGESGTQTLSTAQQILTLNGNGSVGPRGVFNLSLGMLSGTNHVIMEGVLNWSGGTIDTSVAVTVAANGRVTIASGANFAKYLYGNLTNNGTITWQLYGGLRIGGILHNRAGGSFEAQSDLTLYRAGDGRFINDGVFRKSSGAGTLDCQVPLINSGTVDTQTGRITLADGSVFNSGCEFTGSGETRLDSGTNTINGSIHSENLSLLYSATLTGTGSLSGTLTWGGGSIGQDAAITVATNGNLLIASAANFTKNLHGRLTNAGTITWQPHSGLLIGGVLHNLSGALFDAQFDGNIQQGGSGLIVNDGVFRKSAGTGTIDCYVPLINNGAVDTQTGRITLADGSRFNSGCAFLGAGETWLNSGTNTINGSVHSENLSLLYSATLVGTGSFSGTLTWGGGNIGPGAAVNVATNGNLLIASAANFTKYLYGNLTNAGSITWQLHSGLLIGGALHNLPGALFDAQFDGAIYLSGAGAIINEGTFQKSAGAGSVNCDPTFINHGVVKVSSGMLNFQGAYTNPTGTIFPAGGIFQTIAPLRLSGGLLTGWGTVSSDVTNGACIRPSGSNGVLTINGKYNQLLEGRMEFDLAGNMPGTNQSRLNITGAATLRGTVSVRWGDGYMPSPGTNFSVLTFASRHGEFCCFDNFLLLGQGRRLTPVYGATSLTLATVPAPEPATVPLRVTVDGSALVCWPAEFPGYQLFWSTNLGQPDWMLVPGATNCWLESPPLVREKFFRLRRL